MAILGRENHEIYQRRKGRNVALLVIMLSLVALIFAVTMVKLSSGSMMEGFDHTFRPSALPAMEE